MKIGDIVQVKRFDGGPTGCNAVVQSLPNGPNFFPARVQITHPGNAEDGKVVMAQPSDIRTKGRCGRRSIDQMAPICGEGRAARDRRSDIRAARRRWTGFCPALYRPRDAVDPSTRASTSARCRPGQNRLLRHTRHMNEATELTMKKGDKIRIHLYGHGDGCADDLRLRRKSPGEAQWSKCE